MDAHPKVLVVDDDPDFVAATSVVLRSKSYVVVVASDGAEGVRKMREERPDIVLLDMLMPGTDGFTAADQIGRDPVLSAIPVLALTSFSESLGQPFPLKVSEYLEKTTKPNELLEKIEKHLASSKSRRSQA